MWFRKSVSKYLQAENFLQTNGSFLLIFFGTITK